MAQFAPTVDRIGGRSFLVLAWDGDETAALRDRELEGHLEYVERRCNDYLVCGPLKGDDGKTLIGSYFLVNAESAAAARALVSADPYVASGMYREIVVHEAVPSAGRLMGGVIWESAEAIRAKSRQA